MTVFPVQYFVYGMLGLKDALRCQGTVEIVVSIIKRMIINPLLYTLNINITKHRLTRLLRQITGHIEQPKVQQQQMQPQKSHFTFIGRVFFNTLFIRSIVALNSSGATWPKLKMVV